MRRIRTASDVLCLARKRLPLLLLASLCAATRASADATYQSLPFSQNWSNTGLITTSDVWTGVPGVQGYRGDGLTVALGVDPQTVLGNDSPGVLDVNANETNPLVFATGGVTEFHLTDPAVALTGSGTADAPYVVFHVNATSLFNIQVAYKLRDLENAGSVDDAVQPVALQFRTSAASSWTNVAAGFVADATDPPTNAKETLVSVVLPAAANYAATLQIRVITTNATGNDEWVGVDDVSITGTEPFADVTPALLGSSSAATGVAWGDFDGDADLDIYQTKFAGGTNVLYRNDAGTWVDGTSGAIGAGSNGRGATAADVDNDGDLDLHVANYMGASNRLYRNDAGTWVDASSGALAGIQGTQDAVWADLDGDGDVDLYQSNQGTNKLVRNDAGVWVDATSGSLGFSATGQSVIAADFDNDGDADLYVTAQGVSAKLFRNDAGTWVDATTGPLTTIGGSNGASAGDYDNDGDLDLYVCTISGSANMLFRNDLGSWADITSGPLGETTTCSGSVAADFDNDGDLDLYVCRTAGANRLFRNDAGTWVDAVGTVAANPNSSQGVAAADYDGDGDLDLYLVNNGAANKLYRNENASGNHWLNVSLIGTVSNRSAIGARVRVVAGGVTRIREIESLSGHYGQNSLTAEFGLGAATTIDSVVVRWPSGIVQSVTPPAVDQLVTVTEAATLFTIMSAAIPNGFGSTAVWGDADQDGDLDVYVGRSGVNHLLRNDAGTFPNVASGALTNPGDDDTTIWGDVDHDGDLDLYIANIGSANLLLRNDAGTWVSASIGPAGINTTSTGAAWGDYDLDGDLDLCTATTAGAHLFRNDAATWVEVTSGALNFAGFVQSVVFSDLDGDGDPDIYLPRLGSTSRLCRNDSGVWVDATTGPLSLNGVHAAAAGDFDRDGDLDLFLARTVTAANILLRNDGANWINVTSGPLGDTADSYQASWSDFDNDGDLDLHVARSAMNNRLFRQDGAAWVEVTDPGMTDANGSRGHSWGDYDADGDLDLFAAGGGGYQLYRNELANGNHWLHVDLIGTISNRSAIGARVEVLAGGSRQLIEVSGGGGGNSGQNALTAAFGLGANTVIDSLLIRWPSGIVQAVTPVPTVDQAITVTETVPVVANFADVTVAPLDDASESAGVAWIDVDADDDLDLFLSNWGENHLFRNDAGTWVDATSGALVSDDYNDAPAFADYDNDGDLDLYLSKGGLQSFEGVANQLIRNDGGTWVDATVAPLDDAGVGRSVAVGDIENDGDLDLYVVNYHSANKLLRNDAGTWVDATSGPLGIDDSGRTGVFGDYDNDGDLDLYTVGQFDPNRLIRNDAGTWVDVTSGPLDTPGTGSAAAWGDYDNDGDLDLYVTGGSNKLLRNDSGTFVDVTSAPLNGPASASPGWADYDNDGDLDLHVSGFFGSALYRNDGGTWIDATSPATGVSEGICAGWGDYDSDGDLDLYLARFGAPNRLLRNDASGDNHWLHARLVGTISNRSAIGARMTVVAGGVRRMLEVAACTGIQAENSLELEFGLGASTTIDSLIVRWPSGIVQSVAPPAVDQRITITETVPVTADFADVTVAPLDDAGAGAGVAWLDVEDDGDLDLFVSNWGDNHLFRNDAGTWVEATPAVLTANDDNGCPAFADYDNDGDLDLYLSKGGLQSFNYRPNMLVRNDAGVWVEVTSGPLADENSVGRTVSWGDIENDGDLDLFVANRFGSNRLFRNDAGTWVDATPASLVTPNGSHSGLFGDYDNDGDLDLAIAQFIGLNKLYRNDAGTWVNTTNGAFGGVGTGGAWGDADNDGDLDLYFANLNEGGSRLLRNDAGTFVNATPAPLTGRDDAISPAWADFDNDGDLDLTVTAGLNGNALYRNDGSTWVDVAPTILSGAVSSGIAVWGDYDEDGDPDLYLARAEEPNLLLRNDQDTGNHWLHARLVGTVSNTSAIGARMTVVAGGVRRMLEVATCSGFSAGHSLELEFGLGTSTTIDSLIVRWPSGIVWDTTGVAIDQKIVLVEHINSTAVGEIATLPNTIDLASGVPNPFTRSARIDYALPAAGPVRITVHDLQGRHVTTLADRVHEAGRYSAQWDGRSASSARVREGVYFVRLEASATVRVRKIVMTR